MLIAARNAMMVKPDAPVEEFWGLTFTANEPNVTVNMSMTGSPDAVSLEYCLGSSDYTDDSNWTAFDADGGTTPITLANTDDKVYFRAGSSGNTGIAKDSSNYRRFTLSGSVGASGNIMSLLTKNESDWQTVQMSAFCYYRMFRNNPSLTTAPSLPATTLTPACYQYMFYGCTSLTTAPELPATNLAINCYYRMFRGCTSLTIAPVLPATTLVGQCYLGIFFGCTLLSSVEVAFTTWGSTNATNVWLANVASRGTLICPSALGTNSTIKRGGSNCPSGWTVINND